ncbi:MAG: hypothetical protein CL862_07180, partial [Cyanobium sp. NAT70]|nr:hypothetical protein [Cyanobium sp. NAT70]
MRDKKNQEKCCLKGKISLHKFIYFKKIIFQDGRIFVCDNVMTAFLPKVIVSSSNNAQDNSEFIITFPIWNAQTNKIIEQCSQQAGCWSFSKQKYPLNLSGPAISKGYAPQQTINVTFSASSITSNPAIMSGVLDTTQFLNANQLTWDNKLNSYPMVIPFETSQNNQWQPTSYLNATFGRAGQNLMANGLPLANQIKRSIFVADNRPQLSLGNGAIRTINSTSDSSSKIVQFDQDGINEGVTNNVGIEDFSGLNDNVVIKWTTYVRIPTTGYYQFNLIGTGSTKTLDLADNDWSGNRTKGDIVKLNVTYQTGDSGTNSVQLNWARPDEDGNMISEIVPATSMFLTEEAASNTIDEGGENKVIKIYATSKPNAPINVNIKSSTKSIVPHIGDQYATRVIKPKTENKTYTDGDDYTLKPPLSSNQIWWEGSNIGVSQRNQLSSLFYSQNLMDGLTPWGLAPFSGFTHAATISQGNIQSPTGQHPLKMSNMGFDPYVWQNQ